MDPDFNLQDVARCQLCDIPVPSLHCVFCDIYLCKECEGKHISDVCNQHKVVPFEFRRSNPKCETHPTEICQWHCEQCTISVCPLCISSNKHESHQFVDIIKELKRKRKVLKRDLKELEIYIYPKYKEIASEITVKKADVQQNSLKLKTEMDKHRNDWYNEINRKVHYLKIALDEQHYQCLAVLKTREDEILKTISEITQSITDLQKLIHCNEISILTAYNSMNDKFRILPHKLNVKLPLFTPKMLPEEPIHQQFGSLSRVSIDIEENGYTMDYDVSALCVEPQFNAHIDTEFVCSNILRGVSCLNDNNVWTSGLDNIMRLNNLKGHVLKSIQTKSGQQPWDIAVTGSGNLVYTDYNDHTVNIVLDTQIHEVIKLKGWRPHSVCCTSLGDLLVVNEKDDHEHTKVVRYSDYKEKQSIQYSERGQPLYSSGHLGTKYIDENRNFDICVADSGAFSVVVVNQAGKLRFTYTGASTPIERRFLPRGISTDSQSRILIADENNWCIHIIDEDGQLLSFIDNCDLHLPWDLCVDTKDNLFVIESVRCKLKKIKCNWPVKEAGVIYSR